MEKNKKNKLKKKNELNQSHLVEAPVLASIGDLADLLLNAEELVVLAKTLRAARGAGLDLLAVEANDEVRNEAVLRLARAVGDHDPPALLLRHADRLERLRHR